MRSWFSQRFSQGSTIQIQRGCHEVMCAVWLPVVAATLPFLGKWWHLAVALFAVTAAPIHVFSSSFPPRFAVCMPHQV